jgi:hypothetical protein
VPRFSPHGRDAADPHRFETYDCEADDGSLAEELADVVRELYVDVGTLHETFSQGSSNVNFGSRMLEVVSVATAT